MRTARFSGHSSCTHAPPAMNAPRGQTVACENITLPHFVCEW